jgi:hypothetical protein
MFWGFLATAAILVLMIGWSLLQIRRIDRVIKEIDERLGEKGDEGGGGEES